MPCNFSLRAIPTTLFLAKLRHDVNNLGKCFRIHQILLYSIDTINSLLDIVRSYGNWKCIKDVFSRRKCVCHHFHKLIRVDRSCIKDISRRWKCIRVYGGNPDRCTGRCSNDHMRIRQLTSNFTDQIITFRYATWEVPSRTGT